MPEAPAERRRQWAQMRRIVIAAVCLGWLTAVAGAAVIIAEPASSLLDYPLAQFVGGLLIALWGGLTRAATRALSNRRADEQVVDLRREALLDLIVGAAAAFLAFNVAQSLQWDRWYQGIAMMCSGLFGRVVLDAFDKALPQRLRRWISGNQNKEPEP